jgi:hypothetical protein
MADLVADIMSNPATQFTELNAAENARKGHLKRWGNGKPKEYTERRLARVRRQLDKIDRMVMKETDPGKLDRLAAASMRLADQERKLAGRPDPGSYRPVKPKSPQGKNGGFTPEPSGE